MCDQIDGWLCGDVGVDAVVGLSFGCFVGADAVDDAAEHQFLGVGAIAGEKHGVVAVFDEYADVAGRVAGERDDGDVAIGG